MGGAVDARGAVRRVRASRGRAAGIRRRRGLGVGVAGSGRPTPVAGRGVRRWAAPSTACGWSAALGGAPRRCRVRRGGRVRARGRPRSRASRGEEVVSAARCAVRRTGGAGRSGVAGPGVVAARGPMWLGQAAATAGGAGSSRCRRRRRPRGVPPAAPGAVRLRAGVAGPGRGCAVPGPGEFRSDGRDGVRGTGIARRGTRGRERRAGGPLLSTPPPPARGSERSPAGRRVRRRSRGGPCPCPRGRRGRS